jgi:hypothetical protein
LDVEKCPKSVIYLYNIKNKKRAKLKNNLFLVKMDVVKCPKSVINYI